MFADKLRQVLFGAGRQGNGLDPFGEVIYRYDGKFEPFGHRRQRTDDVDSLFRERLQAKNNREPLRVSPNECRVPLALVALLRVIGGI